ncbi:MAG: hypothetical protein ACW98D_07600 [Promethearchaeota archaeon]|jgi:hypothetical protein
MQSERTEVVDFSGEKFGILNIPCGVSFGIILIIVSVFTYLIIIFPNSPFVLILTLISFSIFFSYYYSVSSKSTGKLRRFSISFENIDFTLPDNPFFIVSWSEFEKIEVAITTFELKPYYAFRFQFTSNNSEKEVTISLRDFHKEKIKEILHTLREYAIMMGKKLSIVKETNVSGVSFIEDFP